MKHSDYVKEVAERIVEQLRKGTARWQKPWRPGELSPPHNPVSGTRYRGINRVWLGMQGCSDPRWMTYKQAASVGAQVRKGEKGTRIHYWKFHDEQVEKDEDGKPVLDKDGKPKKIMVPCKPPRMFESIVFNAEQIDGLPPLHVAKSGHEAEMERHARAEAIIANSGADIKHVPGDVAGYNPRLDTIVLPTKDQFNSIDAYYATALHELGHWTGHETRLNRDVANFYGTEGYAREELRAEIASLMLGEELNIGYDPGQHVAYVASWIKVLENDPNEIFSASADAEKISGYMLALEHSKEKGAEQVKVGDLVRFTPNEGLAAAGYRGGEGVVLSVSHTQVDGDVCYHIRTKDSGRLDVWSAEGAWRLEKLSRDRDQDKSKAVGNEKLERNKEEPKTEAGRPQRVQRVDKALRTRISGFEEALNAYNAVEKKGEEKFDVDGREYGSMLEYINKNSLALSNDYRHVGAKVLCLPLDGSNPPDYFVLLPDDSVVYRSGDEPERKLSGHDKEVMQEVFSYVYKRQEMDKFTYPYPAAPAEHGDGQQVGRQSDVAYREQRVDKALRGRMHGFEEALNACKKGVEKFKVDGREYGSVPEYFGRHVASFGDDPRCVGSKRLDLAPCGKEQDHFMLRQGGSSIVYVLGDESERELTGHDKEVVQEVFGYLGRKQDKEITVVQDRGQLGAVREQDRSQTGADVSNTTVVRVKTPEAVEKLSRHGMHPQTVAVVSNEKDGYNLVVVFQHRGATRAEREKFVGQLKKVCPEVLATTLGDGVPGAGSAKDVGKLPGKFSVVLRTSSEIDLDKVLNRSRYHLKHQGQCLEM